MRGGNMAAISPPESPKRRDSLLEDVHTFASRTDAPGLKGYSNQTENIFFLNPGVSQYRKKSENVDNERVSVPSHSEIIECEAKGDQTCKSPKDRVLEPKMAESPGGEQRAFDCSETEDSSGEESHTHKEEKSKYETAQTVWPETSNETRPDAEEIQEKEDSCVDQPSSGKEISENQVENVDLDGVEDNGQHTELASKAKKCRLECKECGKRFNRREMFYLHRHYHAHKDELMPLTCKECGLSFSDRRSLMKHRHEHKEREEPKYEEESGFQCAECEKIFSSVRKLRSHKCIESDDKPFRCTLCRQEFQSKVSITKHMLNHSLDEGFKCKECGKRFPEYRIMRVHQRCHPNFKPYECPECGMVFKYQSVMEDHRRKHTDKQPPHLCNICGKTFKYSGLFQQHQYLHTGEKAFSCPECGKKFAFAQNVKAHCRLHRLCQTNPLPFSKQPTKQTPVSAPVQRKENAHQSEEPKQTFNCPLCPQTCSTPANLRAHMLIHEMEYETLERSTETPPGVKKVWDKGHTCPHCPSTYRDEISLRLHILKSHKYVAQDSDKVAAVSSKDSKPLISENAQAKLKNESLAIRPYKCPECEKTFRHRSVLELHMRIHSKDKPYQCNVCFKGFRFSNYLQQHLVIHSGKKPHKCPDCGKDFAFLQNMRTHQKLHREKPFRCTGCSKGYSSDLQLQHHMLSHNGEKPHKCHLCEKSFSLAYLLRDHINTHTGERPHHCGECNKSFCWLSSLLVHQKIHSRKRQSQSHSFTTAGRVRGRGRRGGRLTSGLSRRLGGLLYDDLHREADPKSQYSMMSSDQELLMRNREEGLLSDLHQTRVQWTVDGEEVIPFQSSQHLQAFASPRQERPSESSAQKRSSPSRVDELSAPRASFSTSSGSLQVGSAGSSSFMNGAVLWSVQPPLFGQELQSLKLSTAPAPTQTRETSTQALSLTVNQLEKSQINPEADKQRAECIVGVPTPAQIDQNCPMPLLTPVSQGAVGPLWDIQGPLGISGKINLPEKQATVMAATWTNIQSQNATRHLPIPFHPFGQGIGTAVWGFQNNPSLLTGQLKPGSAQELQQQTLVAGSQIILNQPTPFFSPPLTPLSALALSGTHPLHTVAINALQRPPHPNIFFTPQGVMTERPPMPQTLPLSQLTSQADHKLGVSHLPFSPDRLMQCMICGISFPQELDLQMHYLQHAQGQI
ncbi:zinc finger protein 665-like [Nerophis ophidion]|uniref:zinc finger protein 665-like n=1 Tax=Nerophis ophidion TaxID=159077 RepID=UPI002AE0AFF3|nr:zinc finger protein 665-like [Nerophis ophidion]